MKNENSASRETASGPPSAGQEEGITPLRLDPDEYREDLDAFDLTEAQQNELLEVLWNIMRTFVELGFGLDSVQMFSTGENRPQEEITGPDSGNMLGKKDTPHSFNKAALPSVAGKDDHD